MKHGKMDMKKGKDGLMNPLEKKAKMNIMKALRDDAGDMMKENLKKVVVSSSSKKGLEEGLNKAKQLLDKAPGMGAKEDFLSQAMANGEAEEEMEDEEGEEMAEGLDEDMGLDEIEMKLQELQALKEKKMKEMA